MSDLSDFLRARLADDERVAPLAAEVMALRASTAEFGARLLREVQAKRRILDWAIEFMEGDYAPWNETCIELLALPYADHPDYEERWRV